MSSVTINYATIPQPVVVSSTPPMDGEIISIPSGDKEVEISMSPTATVSAQTMQGLSLKFRDEGTSTENWDPVTDYDFQALFATGIDNGDASNPQPKINKTEPLSPSAPEGAIMTAVGVVQSRVEAGFQVRDLTSVKVTWTQDDWSGGIAFAFGQALPSTLKWTRVVSSDPIIQIGDPPPPIAKGTGFWGTHASSIELAAVWSVDDSGDSSGPITVTCNFGPGQTPSMSASATIQRGSTEASTIESNQQTQPRLAGTVTAEWTSDNKSYVVMFSGTIVRANYVRISSGDYSPSQQPPMLVAAFIAS